MLEKDVVIVGGGPAGLAAAIQLSEFGTDVLMIDENLEAGGQLPKQTHKFFGSEEHFAGFRGFEIAEKLIDEAKDRSVEFLLHSSIYSVYEDNLLAVKQDGTTKLIKPKRVIFATGASEKVINFPGWTLPGVMGAGAVQTFVNQHKVLPGRKFTIVGSGNVGVIVAYQILQAGGEVTAIVEAKSEVGGYYVHANKALRFGKMPILTSHTIKKASGEESVERVTIAKVDENWSPIKGTERVVETDIVCLAVGLRPRTQLTSLANCPSYYFPTLGGNVPLHDENMRTMNPNVYVAGDVAGVEEASVAIEEGRLAGISVAASLGRMSSAESGKRRSEVKDRLRLLRGGPYGDERARAKERINERYRAASK